MKSVTQTFLRKRNWDLLVGGGQEGGQEEPTTGAEIRAKQPFPEEKGGKYITLETGVEESMEKTGKIETDRFKILVTLQPHAAKVSLGLRSLGKNVDRVKSRRPC